MKSPPNKIPEEEYLRRVKELIVKLLPKGRADASETNELFELYNDRNLPFESGKQCSQCRSRVYKRMLKYYESIKGA